MHHSLFSISDLPIKSCLVAAPMAGISDAPFRKRCAQFGAGLTYSEMILANKQLLDSDISLQKQQMIFDTIKAIQIVGSEPDLMAETAKLCVLNGAELIDINMGCPAKKVNKKLAGSALLQYPDRVRSILSAVVNSVNVPVSLKIRTGWNLSNKNCVTIAQIAEDCGIQAITVHGRTRECLFKGEVDYDSIRQVKSAVSIPVIANGDITSPEKALSVLESTQADAIMIGRGAQGRPWIFEDIDQFLTSGIKNGSRPPDFIGPFVLDHIKEIHQFYGETKGAQIACKHLFWYSQHYVQGEQFRRFIGQIKDVDLQLEASETFFNKQSILKS